MITSIDSSTIALDSSADDEKIKWLLDMSFELTALKQKQKSSQKVNNKYISRAVFIKRISLGLSFNVLDLSRAFCFLYKQWFTYGSD